MMKDDPYTKEVEVLGKHPNGIPSILYFKMKMTGMSERDSILSMEQFNMDDGRVIFISKAVEHPKYPETKKVIRLDIYSAGHCVQDGDDLRYVEFAYFDMKGWFPTRLMNMMIGSMATAQIKTMVTSMRKL